MATSSELNPRPATASQFPKTLVLSRRIPPAATGSGIIMSNLLRQFRSDEMVAVGTFSADYPAIAWQTNWPTLTYGMFHPPEHWRGERWMRRIQWPFLLLSSFWLLLRHRCQSILVVYPDDLFLLAGYLLSRFTRKPLYAYFHNTYQDKVPNNRLAQWLQPRVFAHARHIFVMSAGMQKFYQQRYPGLTCSPLVHTFNETIPSPDVELPALHNPVRLLFIGGINASCAEAASRVRELVRQTPGVTLKIFSGMSQTTLNRIGFTGPNISTETVSRDVLLGRMRKADIMIHPHGFTGPLEPVEYQTIFPTKTIEYLLSQRPILAHLPKDCFLADFYRQYQCALIVDKPTVEALAAGLAQLCTDSNLRQRLVRNALVAARQFRPSSVASHLRKVMSD